jgi:hypothetical protein
VLCGGEADGWICRVDLPAGKHLYQFVVDDEWITDPDNPLVEATNGSAASVILKQ